MKSVFLIAAACLGLAACGSDQPHGATSSQLDSGVTSSNGGGQRATGGIPSVSVGTGGSGQTTVPNSKGAAY